VAITPARKGFLSSTLWSYLDSGLCHILSDMSLFSHVQLCSFDVLLELTHSILYVYGDPLGEMSLRVSVSICSENTGELT